MANGTLNARGRGVELARDLGVEHLGHGIDDVHIVDGQHDRLAQVLVALDVRRDADLMDDVGDDALERGRGLGCVKLCAQAAGAAARTRGLPDAVHEQRRVDRLLHEVHRAEIGTLHEHLVIVDRGCNDYARRLLLGLQPRQQRHTVNARQHEIKHNHVGLKFVDERLCAQPVVRLRDQLHVRLPGDGPGIGCAIFLTGLCHQYTDFCFHNLLLCKISGLRSAV